MRPTAYILSQCQINGVAAIDQARVEKMIAALESSLPPTRDLIAEDISNTIAVFISNKPIIVKLFVPMIPRLIAEMNRTQKPSPGDATICEITAALIVHLTHAVEIQDAILDWLVNGTRGEQRTTQVRWMRKGQFDDEKWHAETLRIMHEVLGEDIAAMFELSGDESTALSCVRGRDGKADWQLKKAFAMTRREVFYTQVGGNVINNTEILNGILQYIYSKLSLFTDSSRRFTRIGAITTGDEAFMRRVRMAKIKAKPKVIEERNRF